MDNVSYLTEEIRIKAENAVDTEDQPPHDGENDGGDMNQKDIESFLDKLEMKTNHKFDLLVAKSDARFEKLFAEMKSEAEKNELRISARFSQTDAIIARTETNLTRWLMGVIFAMLGLTFSFWKTTHDWQVTPMTPPPAEAQPIKPASK